MMNALAGAITLRADDDGLVRTVPNVELMYGTSGGGDGTTAVAAHAALRTAAALVRRDRTGRGAFLDAAGADAVIAQGWIGAVYGWNEDRLTDRRGLRPAGAPPMASARYQYYETADGRFVLFCGIEHKFWARFCAEVGRPDLVDASAGGDDAGPVEFAHGDTNLRRELADVFRQRTQADWVDARARASTFPSGLPTRASPSSATTPISPPARSWSTARCPTSGRSPTSARR